METNTFVVIGLVLFGLIIGALTARSSEKREAIHGGMAAQFFNYLASAIMTGLTPAVLIMVIVLRVHIIQALLIAVGLVILTLLVLLPYAVIERPHLLEQERRREQGWTAEDALTSGL